MVTLRVYLAGSIEGKEMKDDWRFRFKDYADGIWVRDFDMHSRHPVAWVDPTRRESFHNDLLAINEDFAHFTEYVNLCKKVMTMDLMDIDTCDMMLADCRYTHGRGIGTSMEMMYAYQKNIPVIMWKDPGQVLHPFLVSIATGIYYDKEAATKAVLEYADTMRDH